MPFDAHRNFAYSTVVAPPTPAATGVTVTLQPGDGAFFPVPPFNATVAPSGGVPRATTAEVVRVTARTGDVMTLTRAKEGSSPRAILVGDQFVATVTARAFQDIEDVLTGGNIGDVLTQMAAGEIAIWRAPSAGQRWACTAYATVSQSIPNETWTAVIFDLEDFDTGDFHVATGTPTRLTVPVGGSGLYVVHAQVAYAAQAFGMRALAIRRNGALTATAPGMIVQSPGATYSLPISAVTVLPLSAGDYVEAVTFHNTGATVLIGGVPTLPATIGAAFALPSRLSVARISD